MNRSAVAWRKLTKTLLLVKKLILFWSNASSTGSLVRYYR